VRPRRSAALARLGAAALLAVAGAAFAAPEADEPAEERKETVESQRDLDAWDADHDRALPARRLEPARLGEILKSLEPPKKPPTAWERFKDWLRSLFGSGPARIDAPDWLERLFNAIPGWVYAAIFWTLLGALVVALLAIVVVELRAAGIWRRRAKAQAEAAVVAAATVGAPVEWSLGLAGIAGLPLHDQPAALLQWAIRHLILRRVLPPDRSLTNGELLALVRTRAPNELPQFRRLARAAEAVVYGKQPPAEAETRALLDELRGTS
jgi:hypothetical protein